MKRNSLLGGSGSSCSVCAIEWVTAISTAAGVPWPETSAMRIPHRPSGSLKKS